MTDLKEHLDRATRSFEPTGDWFEGSLERVRRRQRTRRIVSGVVGMAIFAASSGFLWASLGRDVTSVGQPVCSRRWSSVGAAPGPGGLTDVSALSADEVWAVGPDGEVGAGSHTVVQHWDGVTWDLVPSPDASTAEGSVNLLGGVAAIAPDDVWAVGMAAGSSPLDEGRQARVLVEHWDGTRWAIVPAPSPSSVESRLNAVAAAGPNDVWAVGYSVQGTRAVPMIQHWDGRRWTVVEGPDVVSPGGASGASLDDVVAFASDDVWAVGSQPSGVLIEHWDGSRWSVHETPDVGDGSFLQAVDGSSPDDVWAVGWTTSGGMESEPTPPVVLHFDGDRWESISPPTPPDPYAVPLAVAAVGPGDVWVSGWMSRSNSSDDLEEFRPLVVRWNGSEWRLVDVGVDASGSMITGAAVAGDGVWLVGRHGGTYTEVEGSLVGARPLAVAGTCAS